MISKIFQLLKNRENKLLLSSFISLISIKGLDFLIPLFILPYLVKIIGIDLFGLLSFSLAFSMYFGAVIHYGYSITAVRDIARVRENKNELSKVYSSFLSVSILLLIISFLLFLVLVAFIPSLHQHWLLHLFSFFFIAMQSLFPSWFFQGIEKMKFIAYINLSTKIIFLISLWFFVRGPDDYLLAPLLNGLTMLLSTVISFIVIHRNLKIEFFKPNYNDMKEILIKGKHSFIAQMAPTLYNSTAMFLLGYSTTNTVVGIYASAAKLIDALNSIAVLISTTFLPYLSRNLSNHKIFSKIMLSTGVIFSASGFIFADELILFFFTKDNMIVSKYFRYLTPMVLFIFIRFTYGPNFLMLINKDFLYKNIVLYCCLLFFIISLYVVPAYEIYGAISIMVSTTFVMAIITFYYYKKYSKLYIH